MTPPATNWKLTLSYDGTSFHGWQVQPGHATIQGALAEAIAHVTGERVLPQGSGRTDAGVHALGQTASFALAAPIPAANLLRALNRVLPPSIRVITAEAAAPTFHARHSALRKTYEYRIFERREIPSEGAGDLFVDGLIASVWGEPAGDPFMRRALSRKWEGETGAPVAERVCPPFLAPFVWDCRWPLQLEPMQRAADQFLGKHDFTSFAATEPDLTQRGADLGPQPNPVKTICSSTVSRKNGLLLYRVTGSGFLHHMVRNLVGTLVEIGRGHLSPSDIPLILKQKARTAAGPTAPACGLFLVSVDYASSQEPSSTEAAQ